jgi:hypothetical protein
MRHGTRDLRRVGDPREAIGPIVTAASNQADAVTVALDAEALAVVFDLAKPVGTGGCGLAFVGNAKNLKI